MRYTATTLVLGLGSVLALLTGCSSSGRDLSPPAMSPFAATATTSGIAVDHLGGFALSSPVFADGGALPADAGAQTGNVSPPLSWTLTPESAAELALVASDSTGSTIHWLVTGLAPTDVIVDAGATPLGGTVRTNSAGIAGWTGPVAAEGTATTVVFRLYALNEPLTTADDADPTEVLAAIAALAFATAQITGTFAA